MRVKCEAREKLVMTLTTAWPGGQDKKSSHHGVAICLWSRYNRRQKSGNYLTFTFDTLRGFKSLPQITAKFTFCPVGTDPVNETFATSGCDVSRCPVTAAPWTTFKPPLGSPASVKISAMWTAVWGVWGDGLNTIVFPQARAGVDFQMQIWNGKFQAPIPTNKVICAY